ncbi:MULTISPECIES: hypothetical protein [Paraglaciecola]|jgi:hypothetical protein|nr:MULTISPECIES: hypothetical protein [Paraglaciecola]AEE25153.1 hypothetical protein Glaag_4230 [Glaciecola sp. 4H-3-7+YE-5]MDO6561128.1 hypothetical protein [Paraglaciecola chathamensis]MDO6840265.1 hypothetical protein [Paraglaciecola chathamensis]
MMALILTDPVAWGSILGIGIIVALCCYYAYLFVHNTIENR